MMFTSVDEIVEDILLYNLDEKAKHEFRTLAEEDLIYLHSGFGREVRNQYQLWEPSNPLTMLNYTPQIEDGVDVNPKHPDAVSFDVIKEIWRRLQ